LSPEDKDLKEQLELLVARAEDSDAGIQRNALELLQEQIRTSTSSMTSVPKPLKFLAPHYATLTKAFESVPPQNKEKFADVLSFLSMTMDKSGERACLRFKLLGSVED
jgi:26S proteasome regulatory subunit N1